ncbi:MAG: di-heme oxidoredictase family protein, partial [Roseibium sp.]
MTDMKPSPGCCCVVSAHRFSVSKVNTSMRRHMSGKFADSGFTARLSRKLRPAILSSLAAGFVFASAGSGLSDDLAGFTRVRDDLSQKDRKRVERVVRPASSFEAPEKFEVMQGGAGTSTKLVNRDSLSHFSANLTFKEEETFKLGNALFRKLWVSSPSSTLASDGLGPLFNARACQSCHIKDGRGHPPEGAADATSMFLRLARPARTDQERQALEDYLVASLPDPVYGGQMQDLAVPGLKAEGRMVIDY